MMETSSEEVVELELESAKETVEQYLARTGLLEGVLEGTHMVAVGGRVVRDLDTVVYGSLPVVVPVIRGG